MISDPPYGIRESMSKVGTDKDYSASSIATEHLNNHIPEKVDYSLDQILADLLNFAARQLTVGGRLVYWLPVIRQNFKVPYRTIEANSVFLVKNQNFRINKYRKPWSVSKIL